MQVVKRIIGYAVLFVWRSEPSGAKHKFPNRIWWAFETWYAGPWYNPYATLHPFSTRRVQSQGGCTC